MLIVHGDRDPHVPLSAAPEHHRLVPQSELLLLDDDHYMIFEGATRHGVDQRLWAQLGLSLGIIGLGIAAPHIDRVVLSLFLLVTCGAQTMLGVQAPPAAVRRAA